jgi:hypothetical protein
VPWRGRQHIQGSNYLYSTSKRDQTPWFDPSLRKLSNGFYHISEPILKVKLLRSPLSSLEEEEKRKRKNTHVSKYRREGELVGLVLITIFRDAT